MTAADRELFDAVMESVILDAATRLRGTSDFSAEQQRYIRSRAKDLGDLVLKLTPDYDVRQSAAYANWKAKAMH